MTTKTLLSLATVSLLALAAQATDTAYIVESTNSWFSVKASDEDVTTGKWASGATKDNSRIVVDTESGNPVTYTPTENLPTADRYRVTGNMTVTLNAAVPDDEVFGDEASPKAALVAVAGSPNAWYGWDGDSWVALTGITTAPVEGTSYNIAIEFFVESSELKIKYIVGSGSDSKSHTLTHSSLDALPSLTNVGFAGYGSFGDFGALGFETFEVSIIATGEDLSDLKEAMGIDGDITAAALNEKGANGLTKWESIVLGLPNESTVPYTAPVQTASGDTLGFKIGNADVGTYASGTAVKVDVYKCATVDGTYTRATDTDTQGDSENNYTATVTPESSGVMYYKIKITFQ